MLQRHENTTILTAETPQTPDESAFGVAITPQTREAIIFEGSRGLTLGRVEGKQAGLSHLLGLLCLLRLGWKNEIAGLLGVTVGCWWGWLAGWLDGLLAGGLGAGLPAGLD